MRFGPRVTGERERCHPLYGGSTGRRTHRRIGRGTGPTLPFGQCGSRHRREGERLGQCGGTASERPGIQQVAGDGAAVVVRTGERQRQSHAGPSVWLHLRVARDARALPPARLGTAGQHTRLPGVLGCAAKHLHAARGGQRMGLRPVGIRGVGREHLRLPASSVQPGLHLHTRGDPCE